VIEAGVKSARELTNADFAAVTLYDDRGGMEPGEWFEATFSETCPAATSKSSAPCRGTAKEARAGPPPSRVRSGAPVRLMHVSESVRFVSMIFRF
jgi:hypothetical protein